MIVITFCLGLLNHHVERCGQGKYGMTLCSSLPLPQDSDAKRNRALRKAKEEQQQAAQRKVEVEHLRQEITRLLALKEKLQKRLEAHKAFPEYLQKVVEKAEQVRGLIGGP